MAELGDFASIGKEGRRKLVRLQPLSALFCCRFHDRRGPVLCWSLPPLSGGYLGGEGSGGDGDGTVGLSDGIITPLDQEETISLLGNGGVTRLCGMALPSGMHSRTEDIVIFRCGSAWAVAAARRVGVQGGGGISGDSPVTSLVGESRGLRLFSVGALVPTYRQCLLHVPALLRAVRERCEEPSAPWESLMAVYSGHNARVMAGELGPPPPHFPLPPSRVLVSLVKASLLHKRTVVWGGKGGAWPGVRAVGATAECIAWMKGRRGTLPLLFAVTVSDLDDLASTPSYLACTTDRVIYDKRHVWDVFVEGSLVHKGDETLGALLSVPSSLSERLSLISDGADSNGGNGSNSNNNNSCEMEIDEALFGKRTVGDSGVRSEIFGYVRSLSALLEMAEERGGGCDITGEDLESLSLSRDDAPFLTELLRLHGVNARIAGSRSGALLRSCCPCLCCC